MIASLRGTLAEKGPGTCVVEAGGVGYLVLVSTHTLAALPERGAAVFLRTRQIVREDSLQLFGFSDADELRLFDLLIGVSGVGPKLALALLSGLAPAAVAAREGGVLPRSARLQDAVAALTSLGYTATQAQDVLRRLGDEAESLSLEDLVRRSLAQLGKTAVTSR